MNPERRRFLGSVAAGSLLGWAAGAIGQLPPPTRPRLPEETPETQEPGALSPPKIDPRLALKQNQKQIQRDVERLFALAEELKKEVGKTDSADVLSLGVVRKAEEIEKLAKQIKNLARG